MPLFVRDRPRTVPLPPDPPTSRVGFGRRRARLLAVNAGLLLAGLVALELAMGGWRKPASAPRLALHQGTTFRIPVHDFYEWPEEEITVTIDRHGFRGGGVPLDRIRMVTVGGSTTLCNLVADGFTWQDVLESRLREDGHPWEIVNAGQNGHSTFGHRQTLERWFPGLGPDFHPSHVLFLVGLNDSWNWQPTPWDQFFLAPSGSWRARLAENSALLRLWSMLAGHFRAAVVWDLQHQALDFSAQTWTTVPLAGDYPALMAEHLAGYRDRLRQLVRMTRARGAEPILVTQTSAWFRRRGGVVEGLANGFYYGGTACNGVDFYHLLRLVNQATLEVARETGARAVDVAETVDWQLEDFYDYGHFTPQGCRRLGGALAESLRDLFAETPPWPGPSLWPEAEPAFSLRSYDPSFNPGYRVQFGEQREFLYSDKLFLQPEPAACRIPMLHGGEPVRLPNGEHFAYPSPTEAPPVVVTGPTFGHLDRSFYADFSGNTDSVSAVYFSTFFSKAWRSGAGLAAGSWERGSGAEAGPPSGPDEPRDPWWEPARVYRSYDLLDSSDPRQVRARAEPLWVVHAASYTPVGPGLHGTGEALDTVVEPREPGSEARDLIPHRLRYDDRETWYKRSTHGLRTALLVEGSDGGRVLLGFTLSENKNELLYLDQVWNAHRRLTTWCEGTIAPRPLVFGDRATWAGYQEQGDFNARGESAEGRAYAGLANLVWAPWGAPDDPDSPLGLAPLRDRGPVVWPSQGYLHPDGTSASKGVGAYGSMVHEENGRRWVYLFFWDHGSWDSPTGAGLKVARAPYPGLFPSDYRVWNESAGSDGWQTPSLPQPYRDELAADPDHFRRLSPEQRAALYRGAVPSSPVLRVHDPDRDYVQIRLPAEGTHAAALAFDAYGGFAVARLRDAPAGGERYLAVHRVATNYPGRVRRDESGALLPRVYWIALRFSDDLVHWSNPLLLPHFPGHPERAEAPWDAAYLTIYNREGTSQEEVAIGPGQGFWVVGTDYHQARWPALRRVFVNLEPAPRGTR